MPIINKGTAFSNGEQLTADKINNLLDLATFNQSATDSASTTVNSASQIVVADSGVTTAKLATDAVETAKIKDANVTKAKIEDVADYKVLGNVSGATAAPAEVSILDEDDMASDSATALATQQSIKAYVDSLLQYQMKYSGSTGTKSVTTSFADWDLSSVVGVNRAMVIIEMWDVSTAISIMLKTKGSSVETYLGSSYGGWGASGMILGTSNQGGTLVVITDASGVIECKGNSSASGINYKIQAYQKLA
jgi:hypothetical protein